jgi:hypothetical protein
MITVTPLGPEVLPARAAYAVPHIRSVATMVVPILA